MGRGCQAGSKTHDKVVVDTTRVWLAAAGEGDLVQALQGACTTDVLFGYVLLANEFRCTLREDCFYLGSSWRTFHLFESCLRSALCDQINEEKHTHKASWCGIKKTSGSKEKARA